MAEVWATALAAVGAATAVAGTVYSISASQAAINAANNVKLPKFTPLNINDADDLIRKTNAQFFTASDADWARRFPDLVKGRDYSIDQAGKEMQGKLAPQVNQGLASAGLGNSKIEGDNVFQTARNLNQPILSAEQRSTTHFRDLLAANPERWTAGLSGPQAAGIAELNTNSQAQFDQSIFSTRLNQFNAGVAQQGQNLSGIVNGIGGVASIGAQIYQNNQLSNYLNAGYYDRLGTPYNSTTDPAPGGMT